MCGTKCNNKKGAINFVSFALITLVKRQNTSLNLPVVTFVIIDGTDGSQRYCSTWSPGIDSRRSQLMICFEPKHFIGFFFQQRSTN